MGMATTKKGARLVGEDRDRLVAQVMGQYDEGLSIRRIAADTERSYGFVHRVLVESGATMRARGGAPRRGEATREAPGGA